MPQAGMTFRIFVSSTFSDLEAERNALQVKVFPRLRELCARYGCRFQAIDLRWGVPEEAGLDQRTMRICLEELERCQKVSPRPNFIVLLGDRYGWQPLPPEIETGEFEALLGEGEDGEERELLTSWYSRDDNALPPAYFLNPRSSKFAELSEWQKVEERLRGAMVRAADRVGLSPQTNFKYLASATEQEIEHGAFSIPDADEHVFCFFRAIEGLPGDGGAGDFVDMDSSGRPVEGAAERVADLKERLEKRLGDHVFQYDATWAGDGITLGHLEKLCEDAYASLARVIEAEAQRLGRIDALAKELEEQEIFRIERDRFYTGRQEMLHRVQGYLAGDGRNPFAVYGEGGMGKSALLAHTLGSCRESYPEAEIIFRFIGATPASMDGKALLQGLCNQIATAYGEAASEVPEAWEDLAEQFTRYLAMATSERPLFIFLDSLDQLSDAYNARGLTWLPAELAVYVKMVLTTRPGDSLLSLRGKLPQENILQLKPMSRVEGGELLDKWLKAVGRALQPAQREEVLDRFTALGNPLYLKLAFEQSRLWSSSTLEIELSPDIAGVIKDLFGRLSAEANHGAILVYHGLGYLTASRYGLSEDELLDLLSRDEEVYGDFVERSRHQPPEPRLPVAVWSRLYYDLEPYLAERSATGVTLLTFHHREFKEVAVQEFLTGETEANRRLFLAGYFMDQPIGERVVEELPFQLARVQAWQQLSELLADLDFLVSAWDYDSFETRAYWAQVEENSPYRMVEAYARVLDSAGQQTTAQVWKLALLMTDTGHLEEARHLWQVLIDTFRETGNVDSLHHCLGNLSLIYQIWGEHEKAMQLHREEEDICLKRGDVDGLARSFNNQALLLRISGKMEEAMTKLRESEGIYRRLGDSYGLQSTLANQATILKDQGEFEQSMELEKEVEGLCRERGDREGLGKSFSNQAVILVTWGNLHEAMRLLEEDERICREIGSLHGLQSSLGNQGNIRLSWGELDKAMGLFVEQEHICRKLGDKISIVATLGNQAAVLMIQGDLDEAMRLFQESEDICRETGNQDGLQGTLGNQGIILRAWGKPDEAMSKNREKESICRETGNLDGLQKCLGNMANILADGGELKEALAMYDEKGDICRRLGIKKSLAMSLLNKSVIFAELGDDQRALSLNRESESILSELGSRVELAQCLSHQAKLLAGTDEMAALSKLRESYNLAVETGQAQLIQEIKPIFEQFDPRFHS